ncbi:MAG: extracellular solute-binding protein [Pseudomonadota bacterium]
MRPWLHFLIVCGLICLMVLPKLATASDGESGIDYEHGFSHLDPLKYPPGFAHFEYFNPDAPRGGTIRIPVLGTWDSFNSFVDRGRQAAGMSFLGPADQLYYDRLLSGAADEPTGQYGRLAEGVKVADDFSWVAFKLREGAYWHDGEPITVDDVIFTFESFRKDAFAWTRVMIADIDRIEKIGPREVRYVMKAGVTPNPSIARSIGVMPVIPKHYWISRDFSKPTTEPPLGSGPYKIKEFRLGRYVVYERYDDYWGNDIPVNRGRFNFQTIKFDYFRDDQVRLEAMRGNLVDIQGDGTPKNWYVEYDFPAARAGFFKMEMFELSRPVGLSWPVFWNMRKERFQDIRVREALWLLFDFEFINRAIYYDFFERGKSLFHGAPDMAATGLPSAGELALLEPYRDQLPERVFTEAYEPPKNSGFGLKREHLERAIALFAEAGWHLSDGKLLSAATGEQFSIDFILVSNELARSLLPYVDNLHRVGITTTMRVPEVSNWTYRMQTSNFDASRNHMYPYRIPGAALRNHFGSASADMGFGVNWGYVKNPVVDMLAEVVIGATDKDRFYSAIRAADRVLLWNFYFIPVSALRGEPVVYWDKFDRVDAGPLERTPWLDGWWFNPDKAERIRQGLSSEEQTD